MKNKGLIVAFSCACIFVVALVATIIVLASGTQNVGSNVSLIYVASDIAGSVSGTYKVGDNSAKDMTNDSGAKVVSFGSDQPTTLSLLSPNETINLLYGESLILIYTFTNSGEEYYANMSYSDTDTPYTNLVFNYKKESDSSYSTSTSKLITVPRLGSTTFSVKISIENPYLNASLKGTIDWALTKKEPIIVEERVGLNIANNTGSIINNNTFSYQTRTVDGKNQFKIVGATPIIDSTFTSGYLNGYYDRTILASTGKVSSIDDLTNNNGAEFFYFCTNPAVVGSTGYNDPGEIYYTSTSDTDLESWYDIPTSETQLYACFMVPNYTTETKYSGSDTQIVISNKVVNIPYKAFYYKSITDVVIPQSIKNIGYGTSNTSYGAFYKCSKLKKVFIPNSVTNIEVSAFSSCSSLASLTIGSGVTSIGDKAFYDCSNVLTDITVSEKNNVYYSSENCLIDSLTKTLILGCQFSVIPDGVEHIEAYAFYNCSGLKSIVIPNGVTSIGEQAFYKCSGLTNITIPNSTTSIGQGAFLNCSNLKYNTSSNVKYLGNNTNRYLVVCGVSDKASATCYINSGTNIILNGSFMYCKMTSVSIPNRVTYIGLSAFYGCSALTSVTIGSGVTSIGDRPFADCSGLTSITVSSNNSVYYSSGNCLIKKSDNLLIQGCKTSVIPKGVTSIGDYAFDGCSGLTSINIPDGVTSIGEYAFENCTSLTSINIPDGVVSIGGRAFLNCRKLTSITIPASVMSIRYEVFDYCNELTSIIFVDTSKTWTVKSVYGVNNNVSVANSAQNAKYLTNTYKSYTWTKNS